MERLDDSVLDAIKRLPKSNQQPNEGKSYKLLAAENEQLTKLKENSVLRNKPLNANNSLYIIDANPKKIAKVKSSTKNIDVKSENQESKELLDLIRRENCIRLLQY